jgi:hypothetical protein
MWGRSPWTGRGDRRPAAAGTGVGGGARWWRRSGDPVTAENGSLDAPQRRESLCVRVCPEGRRKQRIERGTSAA